VATEQKPSPSGVWGSCHETGAGSRWARTGGGAPGEGVEVGEVDLPEVHHRVILTGLPAGVKNGAPGA